MKYTDTKIKELLAWPLGPDRVGISKEWCDWASEISEVVKQLQIVGDIHQKTLELISDYGGKEFSEISSLSDDEGIGGSCNGTWCADQAAWGLNFGKDV